MDGNEQPKERRGKDEAIRVPHEKHPYEQHEQLHNSLPQSADALVQHPTGTVQVAPGEKQLRELEPRLDCAAGMKVKDADTREKESRLACSCGA